MNNVKNLFHRLLSGMLCLLILLSSTAVCHAEEIDVREELIYQYAQYVNSQNLDNYIGLFDSTTQSWMNQQRNDPNFFLGEIVEIEQVKALSNETGMKAAFIEEGEFGSNEVSVYYVQANCDTTNVTSENIKSLNGDVSYVFVFVKENDIWKIGRVSIADINQIVKAGEGFSNTIENIALAKEGNAMMRASLSEPDSIRVKMTKTANSNYWGDTYVDVPFEEYILNVVPNEFVVSHGGEYLKAGTMAVKMYGWYYTIHKKYPNSPGGCDVQDTTSDQSYLATSYANLGIYQSKMDTAYSAIESKALVNNAGNIFLTQYIDKITDSEVGKMGAETALSLSKAGKTYLQILQNAYDNSDNAGSGSVKVVSY